ncbi:60S acidic ribosomal protein P2 [Sesamum alatum]|uniref:60S acidic ribosomal protein P2 n=1 Tax=Sesamum alatum TaxID=300844 RepID=A0AAE1YAN7_9LAMI|nr:60S acidic ribosomal protein P2 [Sesamum alatum]
MKIVAAYLLVVLGGNTSPSAEDLKDILGSVDAEADEDKIELLLSQVKGKDIIELTCPIPFCFLGIISDNDFFMSTRTYIKHYFDGLTLSIFSFAGHGLQSL